MLTFLGILAAVVSDSLTVITLSPASVYSAKPQWVTPLSYERVSLYQALEGAGVGIIRKGPDFALDIEWEGFKRYDIAVSIDGERQHNACPNRMDAPVVKINPLEVSHITLESGSAQLYSGIGGAVRAHRKVPSEAFSTTFYARGGALSMPMVDLGGAFEWRRHGLYARYYQARPYLRGDGKSFLDLYNYQRIPEWGYKVADVSFQGKFNDFRYGIFGRRFSDILFPYLMMDERHNVDVGGFVEFKGHHAYLTRIHHVMDNELRNSPMRMESIGDVWSAGITGKHYELYWRRWEVNTTMKMMNRPPMQQAILPGLNTVHASYVRPVYEQGQWKVTAKLGLQYTFVADTARMRLLENLYAEAKPRRLFVPWSVSVQRTGQVSVGVEAAMEAPEGEFLYVLLKRPMGKPSWYGNPTLAPTARLSGRVALPWKEWVRGQFFVHYVKNYIGLTAHTGMSPYYSYENIDALMAGYSVQARWKWVSLNSTYTWAHNLTHDRPLAEVSPLKVSMRLTSPEYRGVQAYVEGVVNAAQRRVDTLVGETETPAWARLDAGIRYRRGAWQLSLEAVNLTNNVYYQHLSYIRNPFMMQRKVWEPGRSLTIGVAYIPIQR